MAAGRGMNVEVRAVIIRDGRLVATLERRAGSRHLALPGGRVKRWESTGDALVREVHEETGLMVRPGPLLYVLEVVAPYTLADLNLVFLASIAADDGSARHELVELDSRNAEARPPIVAEIARDAAAGWRENPRWLGNVYRAERSGS